LKGTVSDGGVRVPLIVAGPGVLQGAKSDALVNLTDFFRTLAHMLQLDVPAGAAQDSVSFLPQLTEAEAPGGREWVYSEFFEPNGPGPKRGIRLMTRNATHKLIWRDVDGAGPRAPQEFLLGMEQEVVLDPEQWSDADREAREALALVMSGLGPPR
jgi:arylsulfatase A-like enzyme